MSASVLIIDDDRELCALLAEFLQLEGFATEASQDGAEAVVHCRDHPYDAIVLDLMLPGLQGLEVLRQLRKFSATPVLMLTARGEDTDRIVGLEMGADDYLPKPCNPRELVARLRIALALAQAKRVELDHGIEQAIVASAGDLLHKSLENILRNALSHTPTNSTIGVALDQAGDCYRIRIEDQGAGVPEGDLARIFDPLYRTDKARSRANGGHGLGLAIARRAIQRHGGQLQTENSDQGLAVTVLLPIGSF